VGRTTPGRPVRPADRGAGWRRRPRPGGRPRLRGLTAPIVPALGPLRQRPAPIAARLLAPGRL